jgi:hypothetical protein
VTRDKDLIFWLIRTLEIHYFTKEVVDAQIIKIFRGIRSFPAVGSEFHCRCLHTGVTCQSSSALSGCKQHTRRRGISAADSTRHDQHSLA